MIAFIIIFSGMTAVLCVFAIHVVIEKAKMEERLDIMEIDQSKTKDEILKLRKATKVFIGENEHRLKQYEYVNTIVEGMLKHFNLDVDVIDEKRKVILKDHVITKKELES